MFIRALVLQAAVLSMGILGLAGSANAGLIGLTGGSPDVFSQAASISYTSTSSTTGTFHVAGTPSTENPGSVPVNAPRSYVIDLLITHDVNGNLTGVTAGSMTLTGDIGSGSTTLFSSNATPLFGYQTGTTTPDFDILFPTGSGSLDPSGGSIGVILHAGTAISGYDTNLFNQSFSTLFTSTSDTFAPEPASLALVGIGCAGLLMRRRHCA